MNMDMDLDSGKSMVLFCLDRVFFCLVFIM